MADTWIVGWLFICISVYGWIGLDIGVSASRTHFNILKTLNVLYLVQRCIKIRVCILVVSRY